MIFVFRIQGVVVRKGGATKTSTVVQVSSLTFSPVSVIGLFYFGYIKKYQK